MGKYQKLQDNVYAIFNTAEWKANNIPTYPQNFVEITTPNYIRVSIIPSNTGINLASVSGQLIVDIFVSAGKGPGELASIADLLDSYLVGKTRVNTQFQGSTLVPMGIDRDNPILFRGAYSISFNSFGV